MFDASDLIHSYTRADGLRDGVLVAADARLALEAGWRIPVAYTAAVHAQCVALTAAAKRACNDETGRAWDVLAMAVRAARRAPFGARVEFTVYVVRDRVRPTPTKLIAIVGPGDAAEPVVTIMFPEED